MSDDLDRKLRESLRKAGDEYERVSSPVRRAENRQRFLDNYGKRRWIFPFATAVAATATAALIAVGVYVVVDSNETKPDRDVGVASQDPFVTFPIDGSPADIGVRESGAWIADADNGELIHMDPLSGEIVARIPLGGTPETLAIGTGSVWVGDPSAGLLYQVDPSTDELVGEPLDVGDPVSSMGISIGTEAVWVVGGGELRMVDPATSEVTVVETAPQPRDVAANQGTVWVADGTLGLLRLDPSTGERLGEPIPVEGFTGDVYAGVEGVWVANRDDDTILSIDPQSGQILTIARVRGTYLDLGFDETALWALSRATGESAFLTPLNRSTGQQLRAPVSLDGQPVDVATGAGAVWVALDGENAIARFDPVSLVEGNTPTKDI